jgi:hypothetical protein
MKHTKGNWNRLRDYNYSEVAVPIESIHCNGRYIAVILASRNLYDKAMDEATANAKLIAAAPELLEALNGLLAVIPKPSNASVLTDNPINDYAKNILKVYNKAEQAIKKAIK